MEVVYEKDHQRTAAYDNGNLVGRCMYEEEDGKWNISHTIVDEDYRGQGAARELVDLLLDEADKAKVEVIPTCSYAKKIYEERNNK